MQYSVDAVQIAVEEFSKLPGIGRKTAQRLVFFLLKQKQPELDALAQAISALGEKVQYCSTCFNITEADPCAICASATRDKSIICVVEEPNDVMAVERTSEFRGQFHVLGGVLSPLDGVGPDDLRVKELLARLQDDVTEVIFALNASAEGEATAVYLSRLIKPLGLKITRIARGIPMGGDLEFTDEITLARAISGRVEM